MTFPIETKILKSGEKNQYDRHSSKEHIHAIYSFQALDSGKYNVAD